MAVFEWYRLSQVNTNVNRDIVDAYEQLRIQYGNEGLALGFAIPFWFDGTPEAPAVQFGESPEPKAAAFHLIDMLRDLPEVYVLVMAYRNHASGDDGSIELVEREVERPGRLPAGGRRAHRRLRGAAPVPGRLGGRRRRLPGGRGVRPALVAGQPGVGGRC